MKICGGWSSGCVALGLDSLIQWPHERHRVHNANRVRFAERARLRFSSFYTKSSHTITNPNEFAYFEQNWSVLHVDFVCALRFDLIRVNYICVHMFLFRESQ